jgi:hypothetical protein
MAVSVLTPLVTRRLLSCQGRPFNLRRDGKPCLHIALSLLAEEVFVQPFEFNPAVAAHADAMFDHRFRELHSAPPRQPHCRRSTSCQFRMPADLGPLRRGRAEPHDLDAIALRIFDCLAHQPLADLAAAKRRGHFVAVNDDQAFAGAAVSNLGLQAVDDDAVAP